LFLLLLLFEIIIIVICRSRRGEKKEGGGATRVAAMEMKIAEAAFGPLSQHTLNPQGSQGRKSGTRDKALLPTRQPRILEREKLSGVMYELRRQRL
jgi:hypothetical protein